MLITETGVEWMSGKLPRSISDIEAFMAAASKSVSINRNRRNMLNNVFVQAASN